MLLVWNIKSGAPIFSHRSFISFKRPALSSSINVMEFLAFGKCSAFPITSFICAHKIYCIFNFFGYIHTCIWGFDILFKCLRFVLKRTQDQTFKYVKKTRICASFCFFFIHLHIKVSINASLGGVFVYLCECIV